jgi:hypothetical protein
MILMDGGSGQVREVMEHTLRQVWLSNLKEIISVTLNINKAASAVRSLINIAFLRVDRSSSLHSITYLRASTLPSFKRIFLIPA